MFRPSMLLGFPAFGWTDNFFDVTPVIRSMTIQHRLRTDAAVQSQDIGAPIRHSLGEDFRWRSFETIAVLFNRHLGDQRPIAHFSHALNGSMDFVQIGECFEDENIDAARQKRLRLFAENIARFIDGHLSPGFDPNSERTNRPRNIYAVSRGFARDARALDVDLPSLIGKTMGHQLRPISAEGIRFDDVDAGLDVIQVNFAHQLRVREIQSRRSIG